MFMRRLMLAFLLPLLLLLGSPAMAGETLPAPVQLYVLNCWGCHRQHGEGIPHTVPRLSGTVGYFLLIPGGREYLIEVPGVAGSALSDAEIAEVMNWLLVTFSKDQLPPNFKPYTTAEITRYRSHELNDIKHVRGALAERLAVKGIAIPPE